MSRDQMVWWRILIVVIVILMIFGLVLVLLPDLTLKAFSLLMYSSARYLDSFGVEATSYIRLAHAVLGAVMFGWAVLLLFVALGPLRRGSHDSWRMFVVSLIAWYVPDTAFSLFSGYWPNAALNTLLAALFAVPLIALRSRPQLSQL